MMPRPPHAEDGLDKFRRYRATRRARGMKLLRVWVPDPHAPGFREEAQRQASLLRGAPEEREALEFIAAAADLGDAER
jgi:Antitoxin MazE-like